MHCLGSPSREHEGVGASGYVGISTTITCSVGRHRNDNILSTGPVFFNSLQGVLVQIKQLSSCCAGKVLF
jgi:hypothetical protein